MARKYATCTIEGMTPSQPGIGVSVTTGTDITGAILHVYRMYPDLPNKWGGRGVFKHADCDGMRFVTSEAAWEFALWRGYLRRYYTAPDLRARRVEHGRQVWR